MAEIKILIDKKDFPKLLEAIANAMTNPESEGLIVTQSSDFSKTKNGMSMKSVTADEVSEEIF